MLPESPLPTPSFLQRAVGLAGTVKNAVTPAMEIFGGVSTAFSFGQHSAAASEAVARGDHDAEEDNLGEAEMDLFSAVVPGLGLARTGFDYYSRHWGDGATLGQHLGRDGGPNTSDLEAEARIARGDLTVHSATGNDRNRLERNRAHEAEVQANIARLRAQRAQRDAAQEAAYRKEFPNGHPTMDRSPLQAQQQHDQDIQRAATFNAAPVTPGRFTRLNDGSQNLERAALGMAPAVTDDDLLRAIQDDQHSSNGRGGAR
jgi:hypothetical protein